MLKIEIQYNNNNGIKHGFDRNYHYYGRYTEVREEIYTNGTITSYRCKKYVLS